MSRYVKIVIFIVVMCLADGAVANPSQSTDGVPFRPKYSSSREPTDIRKRRAATAEQSKLWPNATIPFKFSPDIADTLRRYLVDGMTHWENHTCIEFVDKDLSHNDYVVFSSESCGCCSSVGHTGGRQTLSLQDYCANSGVAMHELGHLIGFWHEHTRPDRDKVIKVLWGNIIPEQHINFEKKETMEIESFGRPYDLRSIMHYSPLTFSNGKGPTMRTLSGEVLGKQPQTLSGEDILQARLLYKCPVHKCIYDITDVSGSITSPYYPNTYLSNQDCQWVISIPPGRKVILKFDQLNIQDSYKCSADYLRIHEYNSTGNLIGLFCGSGLPPTITSSVSLWLTFHSDWILTKPGFSLHYQVSDIHPVDNLKLNGLAQSASYLNNKECVQISRASHGVYHSVAIPTGNIASVIQCSFLIDGSQSKLKTLKLSLSTNQSRAYGSDCLGDVYVPTIHHTDQRLTQFESSGDNEDEKNQLSEDRWEQVHYQCGNDREATDLLLEHDIAFLIWSSDRHRALTLNYWIDYDECEALSPCDHICENTVEGYQCSCNNGYQLVNGHLCEVKQQSTIERCHRSVSGVVGKLISSTEPHTTCTYDIVRPGYKITLRFLSLRLPKSGDCDANYIEVISKRKLLANLCDNVSDLELSAGESMSITQYTDTAQVTKLPFFIAEYSSHIKQEEACEYSIKDSGEFFSPNYSSPYEPNIICEWRLSVPKSRIARLTIVDMNIEETDECLFDRIIVHDGRNKKSPVIGTLCGDRVNDIVINATGSRLVVVFKTDQSGSGRGFRARLSSTTKTMSSPATVQTTPTTKTTIQRTVPTTTKAIISIRTDTAETSNTDLFSFLWDGW